MPTNHPDPGSPVSPSGPPVSRSAVERTGTPADEAWGPARFADELIRPFLTVTAIAVTAVEFPGARLIAPPLATVVFAAVALCALGTLLPWTRLPSAARTVLCTAYVVLAAVLLPLAQTTLAPLFAFLACGVAGGKLSSRRAALGVAVTGSLSCAVAVAVTDRVAPGPGEWVWWLALTVGFPVYIGMSNRDREEAVVNARRAAAEAERAAESEARNAALGERGRIAREIHDVLSHSLSGIALQLDMADALTEEGRAEQAAVAIRRARSMAVESIAETRRAVHALREDTVPLPETLRLMAQGAADPVEFTLSGEAADVRVESAQTVIRVAQEALTNAVKYAPGAACQVRLEFRPETVLLSVTNGPAPGGPPGEEARGTGMGLVGMRERAALLGGTLNAGPDPGSGSGQGWTVRLEVPR
ncbi:sensor histidine kinase [Streptomyces sp. NPDC056161]|uniref:sensor histidine kinase n=1 Tax=Streptomyces sp. NPDC056161 TaxID=3345732 RepID=UPI0035D538E2